VTGSHRARAVEVAAPGSLEAREGREVLGL